MKTIFSCRRSYAALAAVRLTAGVALSLFLVAGFVSASSHARPLPQTDAQERDAPVVDARDVPAQTLFNQAVSIERESPERALSRYEEVMKRFGRAPSPSSRQFAAKALLNKASVFNRQGNDREAIITYERIERNFGNERSPAIREVLASALVSKAETLYQQGDTERALATYAQLDEQFNTDDNEFIKRLIDITRWRATEIRTSSKMTMSSAP